MTAHRMLLSYISSQDHRLMRRVNRWRAPKWIRVWTLAATRAGDGWLWYSLGIVLLIAGGPQRFVAVTSATLAAVTGVALFIALKRVSGRKRPCAIEPHCWATLLPPDQFSFPSGHSITAFAVVVPVAQFYPEIAAGLFFCAVSVAVSRIILGMHFLSDVLAGCAIGALLGCGSLALFT